MTLFVDGSSRWLVTGTPKKPCRFPDAAPVFACFVPGSNVVVTYLIAEQYHVVRIIEIASLRAPGPQSD